MIDEIMMVLRFWLVVAVAGIAVLPLAASIFKDFDTKGYVFAKIVGLGGTFWLVWVFATLKILPFGLLSISLSAALLALVSWVWWFKRGKSNRMASIGKILAEEGFFLLLIFVWAFVRGHSPDIRDLEKFMDFGFAQSIYTSQYFPPQDMWFAGESINYYYFGHLIMAGLAKVAGVDLVYGFNLMLALLFAFCFSGAFSISRRLLVGLPKPVVIGGGIIAAYLVTMGGNLHTIYLFTQGYSFDSDNPPPFWEILINPLNDEARSAGWQSYWYPNATRFIPFTIHEFPSYSFVVSDVHGHVLSIPFALLAIALLVVMIWKNQNYSVALSLVYGVNIGWLFTTNALDAPVYLGLFGVMLLGRNIKVGLNKAVREIEFVWLNKRSVIIEALLTVGVFVITAIPFLHHFDSFVSGVGINCPPSFLAAQPLEGAETLKKIGPIVIEGVEKCQKSPVWMMLVLWGFLLLGGLIGLKTHKEIGVRFVALALIYCAGLILFAEFFYFKDIYPQHFRSNTMFKLGYQAFIIMSIVGATAIVRAVFSLRRKWLLIAVLPFVYLVAIYPFLAIRGYFGEIGTGNYKTLYGFNWFSDKYPDDFEVANWLKHNSESVQPVILEAAGDSYTDFQRVSMFTGFPTVAGWAVHEWLWRGEYGPIADRATDVAKIYESQDIGEVKRIIEKYKVQYIFVGELEKQKYLQLNEPLLSQVGKIVFKSGQSYLIKTNE